MHDSIAAELPSSGAPFKRRPFYRRFARMLLAIAFVALAASPGFPQTPTTQGTPETPLFKVQVWGDLVADFSKRVSSYDELRNTLANGLPPLTLTDDPAEIDRVQRALARRIRDARAGAKQGDIFTPTIAVEFKKALVPEVDDDTFWAIMDDNPGEFSVQINGTYPTKKTLSTVPPGILAVLPRLPDGLQYRFLGRHLILLDDRANVILDRIPDAIVSHEETESRKRNSGG